MHRDPSIKQKIEEELGKAEPDWRLIERISRQYVDSDSGSVRFSVDAAHISRLGLELVAKQETALAELIKNAYDADATHVSVEFNNHDHLHGTLTIRDDGEGMPGEIVREAWMRLSTTNKQEQPFSPRFGRVRAGKKGIGRFAVQRLGKSLMLETEVFGENQGLRVFFDWETEFHAGKDLNDIFSTVETYEKPAEQHGTKLTIKRLREKWSDAAINRVWRTVLLLQSPFGVDTAEHSELAAAAVDPGFDVEINGITSRRQRTSLGIESGFLEHALAEISGEINVTGKAMVRVHSRKLRLDETFNFDEDFPLTGPLKFDSRYFIYSSDSLSGLKAATAQEMGRQYGGIRIYRNGFRVAPYGERADDWLKLDRDTSRRTLLVPANNVNFFGQVRITADHNPLFEETSSREGLIENEAFEELRDFVRKSVEWAVKRVAAVRGRKQTTGQKDFVSTARPPKPSEVLGQLEPFLNGSNNENKDSSSNQGSAAAAAAAAYTRVRDNLLAWEGAVERREAESLEYEEMLRILASLGLSISVFGHEIKGMRSSVAASVEVLHDEVDLLDVSPNKTELLRIVSSLKSSTARMFDLGGYIAGLMSSTESRELRTLSVKGALERFQQQFETYMERQKIQFASSVEKDELRTVEMHSSELDSVLLNFLTNSIKSIKRAKVSPRRIKLRAFEDGGYVVFSFQDNGLGIPENLREKVFDAFFTTSLANDDALAGPGTGLGLKIVSDIASSYGGSVVVGTADVEFRCNMEFRVPIAGKRG